MHKCKCGETDLNLFAKDKSRPSGYQYICKKCDSIKWTKYDTANKGKSSAHKKEYRNKNRKQINIRQALWAKSNPHKFAAKEAKRRADKSLRTPKWLTELHYQQIAIFYESASKLAKEFGIEMEVDHIVPLHGKNVSGLHVPWNLQVITKIDNGKKSNKFG